MLKTLLQQALQNEPKKLWPTYDELELDRSDFLTSSQVGSCIRKAYFEKNDYPGGGFENNGFAERGHAVEAWLVDKLRHLSKCGFSLYYMGKEQRSFYDPDLGLSGTPDGLLKTPEKDFYLIEIKSVDPRKNKTKLPDRKHVLQAVQNIMVVEQCLNIEIKSAILSYVDASNFFDILDFPVTKTSEQVAEIQERANRLWSAKSPDELPAEGIMAGDCEHCPFTGICSDYVSGQKRLEVAKVSAKNFSPPEAVDLVESKREVLEAFIEYKDDLAEQEKQVDAMKSAVTEIVAENGGIVYVNDYVITYDEYPGKETLDKEALINDGIDLDDYMKAGRPYGRLSVKRRKANG